MGPLGPVMEREAMGPWAAAGIVALVVVGVDLALFLVRMLFRRPSPPSAWALACLALAAPALAQDPTPESRNAGPATVSVRAGGLVTLTGDADTAVTPTALLEVDGPIVLGNRPRLRGGARIGITSEPGEDVSFSDVATFRAAEVGLGLYYIVGRAVRDGQDFTTALVGEAGFASRLPTGERTPPGEVLRHYGIGFRLTERVSGISFTVLYGVDESTGDRGYGAISVYGGVPIPGTSVGSGRARLMLVGDAALPLGPKVSWLTQRNVVRLGLVVDVGPRR